jgi:hypothetical protein
MMIKMTWQYSEYIYVLHVSSVVNILLESGCANPQVDNKDCNRNNSLLG